MQLGENKCANEGDPVVVVDDSETDISITKRVYERSILKNPLLTFTSGEAFLQYMSEVRSGESRIPSLVLMDINMPNMNGFETIIKLREFSEFTDIPPIVMLTNSNCDMDVEKSFESGANGFQTKDFNFERYTAFFNSLKAG